MSIFDAPSHHHDHLPPSSYPDDTHHRPIELQSPSDLTYITNKISLDAQQKLTTHLPPPASPPSDPDPLRTRIQELLDVYIHNVVSLSKGNLSINGLRGAEMEESLASTEVMEEFDGRLAGRIQGLSGRIEGLRMELAGLRRERLGVLKREWEGREEGREEVVIEEGEAGDGVDVGVDVLRLRDVKGSFESGVRELERVKGGIGGTVERLERAKRGVESVLETNS